MSVCVCVWVCVCMYPECITILQLVPGSVDSISVNVDLVWFGLFQAYHRYLLFTQNF